MNKDTLKGRWHEVKGQLKSRWGKLTDDDLTRIEGNAEELRGVLQQRYGLAKEQAERDSKAFFEGFKTASPASQPTRTEAAHGGQRPAAPGAQSSGKAS